MTGLSRGWGHEVKCIAWRGSNEEAHLILNLWPVSPLISRPHCPLWITEPEVFFTQVSSSLRNLLFSHLAKTALRTHGSSGRSQCVWTLNEDKVLWLLPRRAPEHTEDLTLHGISQSLNSDPIKTPCYKCLTGHCSVQRRAKLLNEDLPVSLWLKKIHAIS